MAEIDKTPRRLERHLKGLAHYKRIKILLLLSHQRGSNGLTLEEISEHMKTNTKNISHHTSKLQNAGLLDKKYQGKNVVHSLSPYGARFIKFLLTLAHS